MEIQIIGKKNCFGTKKAQRYFKDRNIKFQFRDLAEKGLAKGELQNISARFDLDDLIDKEGKQYKKRNLQFMVYDLEEELLEDPLLLKTPIVRYGKNVFVGENEEGWSVIVQQFKEN